MGQIEGSKIRWNMEVTQGSGNFQVSWYCQQHRKYDHLHTTPLSSSFTTLKAHLEDQHGNVEQ